VLKYIFADFSSLCFLETARVAEKLRSSKFKYYIPRVSKCQYLFLEIYCLWIQRGSAYRFSFRGAEVAVVK